MTIPTTAHNMYSPKADPFTISQLEGIDATYFHLGALLADDFPLEMLRDLSKRGLVSVDSQGYLREVRDQKVYAIDWKEKKRLCNIFTH